MPVSDDLFERIRFTGEPLANPQSVVISGEARFTILTSRLLRMEWAENGQFEDRGTFAFPTRNALTPQFTVRREGKLLIINTEALELRYVKSPGSAGSKFRPTNLSITSMLNGKTVTWSPGMPNPGNLRGTRRTLDECEGEAALDEGILSRSGWALYDDSRSVVFTLADGWVAPRPDHALQDWYFFGYGHAYQAALAEYTRFGGSIPLVPRFALGAWWSRYWAYTSQDLKDIANGFEQHHLPLDVFVIDMDWHLPDGWTGYTWNRELIPDPPALLTWLHQKGLKLALNLHPAQGVQPFEEIYPRFAEEMGVEPASGQAVAFHISDKRFAKNYFELLHHPREEEGVDFWWMDWQQGEGSEMKGLDPLVWLNHTHFQDSVRRGKRPMVYSRWGGLGNHRYQTGFSGDTVVGWPALQFQPYFTTAASNVGYGWWGHDIGGHMGGATEPELFARWVQFGALSPALKLHGTKDPRTERRPWLYPEPVYQACKTAFHWRYQLIPYIYSMAKVAAESGVSLCRPMYYEYPEEDGAYAARYQYFFGDQMIAAPFVFPADPDSGLAVNDVWVPAGEWVDYTSKETFTGPRWVRLTGDLESIPMLMKPGAILPLAPDFRALAPDFRAPDTDLGMASGSSVSQPRDRMLLAVFPGKEGRFRLYEDDGESQAFQQGECEWTEITSRMPDPLTWEVRIAPVEGCCPALPAQRAWEVRLEGSRKPQRVLLDGVEITTWIYQPETLTTTIWVPMRSKLSGLTLTAQGEGSLVAAGKPRSARLARIDAARLLGRHAGTQQELLEQALQAGAVDAAARLGGPFVRFMEFITPEDAANQLGRLIVGGPAGKGGPRSLEGSPRSSEGSPRSLEGEKYDLEVSFTLYKADEPVKSTLHLEGISGDRIIDTPFAFDGQIQAVRWEAEARLGWRGHTLSFKHVSSLLIPGIPTYRGLVVDPTRQEISPKEALHPANLEGWKFFAHDVRRMPNLRYPFAVRLFEEYRDQLGANEPLMAYLVATITSPVERDATLLFQSAGEPQFYWNGKKITVQPVETGELAVRYVTMPMETLKLDGLHLRTGQNTLLVRLPPGEDVGWRPWYFGALLVDANFEPLTDLGYS